MKLMFKGIVLAGRAWVLVPVLMANSSMAASAPVSRTPQYSVVNLAPGTGLALLNQRGQAAFATYSGGAIINGFFDGRRVHRVGPAGNETVIGGLNDLGVVVGQFNDAATPAPFNYRAFSWTVAGGLRALPGPGTSFARAINNRNQAVGSTKGRALYGRAYRWNPDGTTLELGPLPASLSEALDINDSGLSVGYADVAQHDSHAVVWDAHGAAVDLGTLGGTQSIAQHVNVQGQVIGTYFRDGVSGGFMWTRTGGLVKIAPQAQAGVRVTGLNDAGAVAGNLQLADTGAGFRYRPFLWSTRRGAMPLPMGGADHGSVDALNNVGGMVGFVARGPQDALARCAAYWQGMTNPVDLNGRLYRAPAGLVLYAGKAINDKGDILADSNAGLVLLHPGTPVSDAPVMGPIAGATANDTVTVGARIDLTVAFVATSPSQVHAAVASVDDGCPQDKPVVREVRGNGEVDLRHAFCRAGSFTVKVRVTDKAGNATEVHRQLTVVDAPASIPSGAGT